MPIELPRGLPIAVDTWTPASALKRHRFLTHAHRDHLTSVTTTSSGAAVYASRLTILIVRHIFPQLGPDVFMEMELGTPVLVQDPEGDFTVTAFDANHCPGSAMFLFEGTFGNVLHTGDCRLTPDCIQGLPLRYINAKGSGSSQVPPSCRIDYLFLDCTFVRCPLRFLTKEASIRQVINCIWEHPNAPTVYLVSDMLGQEEILIEVSRAFGSKIYVDKDKNSECYHTLSLFAPEIVTQDAASRFQVIAFPRLSERAVEMLTLARAKQQPEPLIIRSSSQWYAHYEQSESLPKQKLSLMEPMRDEFGVWHVCFSMHSSREELDQAVQLLQPKWVVSTTPPCLAMDLAYVKKHCFLSRLGPDDPLWKLLGMTDANPTVTGSLQAVQTVIEAIKGSEEEDTSSAVCSQVLQDEEPTMDDFEIKMAPPVTLFGRARFRLPEDCELLKVEYESVCVAEEVKFKVQEQNSGTKSLEPLKDVNSIKGAIDVIDSNQVAPKELHDSAKEFDLNRESNKDLEVSNITEGEVQYRAQPVKDAKCDEGMKQTWGARFEVKEESSIAKAKMREIYKPTECPEIIVEEAGKGDKLEATGKTLSKDRAVLTEIGNTLEGLSNDRAGTSMVGSSKVLNAKLRRLYRSMNVAVPRPLLSLVELMGASKRPKVSSSILRP